MPATSGASHGFAAFTTLIIGTILSKLIWDLVPPVGEVSLFVVRSIQSLTGADVPVNEQFAGALVVMVALSTLWGVVYHIGRHQRE